MTRGIQRKLAWVSLLALSTSLAYALNTGTIGALSADSRAADSRAADDGLQSTLYVSECRSNPECDGDASDPCALDTDGVLYVGSNRWLPAGRIDPLRDEAIACLALPDLRPTGRVIHRPSGAFDVAFAGSRKG